MEIKIRKMTIYDAQPLYRLLSDPKVMEYLEPAYSKEQTEQFLIKAGLSERPLIYAVEKDGSFIGYVPHTVVVDLFPCCVGIHGIVSTHVETDCLLTKVHK